MYFRPRDSGLLKEAGVSRLPASGSLLYETFWTVWERSTLLSTAVKQLVKLLVQVLIWEKDDEVIFVKLDDPLGAIVDPFIYFCRAQMEM